MATLFGTFPFLEKALLTGKFTGNSTKIGAVWQKIARKNAAKSVSCRTIPYKMKQGINSRRTGNFIKPSREFAASCRELPAGSRSFLHRGCGHGLILSCSSEFESSVCSQAVWSPGYYFPVCENPRHSRGLGWCAPVSVRQFLPFRSLRDGLSLSVIFQFPYRRTADRFDC
jgi:hypothetical protein